MHFETPSKKNPDGTNNLTIRLFLTDDERSGLTYRHQIRGTVSCPVIGTLSLAALVGRDGVTLHGLSDDDVALIDDALRIELRRVAEHAAVIAKRIMDGVMPSRSALSA